MRSLISPSIFNAGQGHKVTLAVFMRSEKRKGLDRLGDRISLASESPIELNPCPSPLGASNGPAEPHAATYVVPSIGTHCISS